MGIFDKNFFEILSSQMVSLAGGLLAGTLLAVYLDEIMILPGILVLLPGLLELRGNISGSFASRLSSGLFLGIIKPEKLGAKIIRGNLIASFVLATMMSAVLGIIAMAFNYFLLGIIFPQILLIALVAGLIANAIEIPLTLFATLYLFRKGRDPNNIMGPFISTTGDITSIISLLAAMVII